MSAKLTTEIFIERARAKRGNKYDYSKVEYKDAKTKIIIICPEHGEFLQRADSHLQGQGCPKCKASLISELRSRSKKSPTELPTKCTPYVVNQLHKEETFINRAQIIHSNRYDYSRVNYVNTNTKVEIICPEHGSFWITPKNHLQGSGCPECYKKEYRELLRLNMESSFLEKANIIQNPLGRNYDYSNFIYVDNETKGEIICPKHGSFWQTPHDHLRNRGCPKCSNWKLETAVCDLLQNNNICSQAEKGFDWLTSIGDKNKLRCDYYLPDYNLVIECQGKQHFKYSPYYHINGKSDFYNQTERDDIKNQLCKEHGVDILYFAEDKPYIKGYRYPVITDINELLKEILKRGDNNV